MAKSEKKELDLTTEERIKQAAGLVFTRKGYGNARTRDIAEEAGINLALLNYYFRSKEKLFQIVMAERVNKLFGSLTPILNEEDSTLDEKLEKIVDNYMDMLLENPDLPIFVLSEIRNHPDEFANRLQVKKHLTGSAFVRQMMEKNNRIHPFHFLMNLLGMTLFPFLGKPVLQPIVGSEENYNQILEQRRKLIPGWIRLMLES